MNRKIAIMFEKLPVCYLGFPPQRPLRGIYRKESEGTDEVLRSTSASSYDSLEDDRSEFKKETGTSCPFTHHYAGYVKIERAGSYRFFIRSNVLSQLRIYNQTQSEAVSTSGETSEEEVSEKGTISFSSPGYYKVEFVYQSKDRRDPAFEAYFAEASAERGDKTAEKEFPV